LSILMRVPVFGDWPLHPWLFWAPIAERVEEQVPSRGH
jgi:hypothetical protein